MGDDGLRRIDTHHTLPPWKPPTARDPKQSRIDASGGDAKRAATVEHGPGHAAETLGEVLDKLQLVADSAEAYHKAVEEAAGRGDAHGVLRQYGRLQDALSRLNRGLRTIAARASNPPKPALRRLEQLHGRASRLNAALVGNASKAQQAVATLAQAAAARGGQVNLPWDPPGGTYTVKTTALRAAVARAHEAAEAALHRADERLGKSLPGRTLRGLARNLANPNVVRAFRAANGAGAAYNAYQSSPCKTTAGRLVHAAMAGGVKASLPVPLALLDVPAGGRIGKTYDGFVASFAAVDEDIIQEIRGQTGTAAEAWQKRARRGEYGVVEQSAVRVGEVIADGVADGVRALVDVHRKYNPVVVLARRILG